MPPPAATAEAQKLCKMSCVRVFDVWHSKMMEKRLVAEQSQNPVK
jgi:hypothetical protein